MSKFLFAPFMMNLGESQRLSKLANYLFQQGHEIHVIGESHYPFLFDNDAYVVHHCQEDGQIYNKERYESFFSLSTDFNFLSEEEIELVCSKERKILCEGRFDAVITGYRLTIIASCRLENTPVIWLISGSTHISEIVENADGIIQQRERLYSNSLLAKKMIEKLIMTYSVNVKTWNNYLIQNGGVPFRNALELFSGDLNLITDYSRFYNFSEDSKYKIVGPILIDKFSFSSLDNKNQKKVLLSFGTSFKISWVEAFIKTLPTNYQYILTTCGEAIASPGSYIELVDFVDFEKIAQDIQFAIIHGGQGTVYAMASQGVPFIGIPFFNEQFWNIKKFVNHNCAYLVKEADIVDIKNIINDFQKDYPIMKKNILALSREIKRESSESLEIAGAEIEKFIRSRQI